MEDEWIKLPEEMDDVSLGDELKIQVSGKRVSKKINMVKRASLGKGIYIRVADIREEE